MRSPESRFLALYDAASPETLTAGREWYPRARATAEWFASIFGCSTETAAGVIAALSQREQWGRNLACAVLALSGAASLPCMRHPASKALAIRNGASPLDVLRGPKIRAFYQAILGDASACVLDSWMLKAAGFPAGHKATTRQYVTLTAALREAASVRGESPAAFQAIVWCQIRGSAA